MFAIKLALTLLCVASNVFGDESDEGMACMALLDSLGEQCCESVSEEENIGLDADVASCLASSSEEMTCDNFKCMLNQKGLMKGENIDEEAARSRLQKIAEDHGKKQMTERIMRECLNGKYLEYPPEDACPAIKFFTCSFINAQLACTKWKSSDKCSKIAENAKKCRELADE